MRKFDKTVKEELISNNLIDTVLEIGWNYLQAQKAKEDNIDMGA